MFLAISRFLHAMVRHKLECHSHSKMHRPSVTFQPQLESLDDRIVPATLRWTDAMNNPGDPNSANYPANWQVLVDPVNNIWQAASQPP